MIQYQAICPHCDRQLLVTETTSAEHRAAGLVYLTARCHPCRSRIDAAGEGELMARSDMADRIRRRQGTTPEMWLVRTRRVTRRRGVRR